eukprot:1815836-Pleurochrysis_carterae.AAC.1
MRRSTITAALPSPSHQRKHCIHKSARCPGQNRYADFASTTYSAALGCGSPGLACRAQVPAMASALASACTFGRRTTLFVSGTPAFTASAPPKLAFVVTRGFS